MVQLILCDTNITFQFIVLFHAVTVSPVTTKAAARTLMLGWGGGEGGAYSYIHVLPDEFLFKLINLNLICKETRRAERQYIVPTALLTA